MERLIHFFKKVWLWELVGIVLLGLLIWFVAPLISIAGNPPWESESSRLITIVLLVIGWLTYRLWRYMSASKREKQLIADLSSIDETDANSAAAAELSVLGKSFEEALNLLKSTYRHGSRHSNFLYELPWYAIIGAPGAGKTTALINSGLNFPLLERLGRHVVKGVSGTRDCDWWFTDEAVLLDTAGRYTTQDSHQVVDATAWNGFLQLLKKYRPRRPLNGVFVALSISDLLQSSDEERRQHAMTIRRRIQELNDQLGVQLPIYVLCTKADLLAGFSDFFATLNDEERNQVWGETFTLLDRSSETPNTHLEHFAHAYDELVGRVSQRCLRRIQEERDVRRRVAIFDFPRQMAALKPVLTQFLDVVFATNRYEQAFFLRGIYFTSGTQQGTPIDRVLAAMASSFKLDKLAMPIMSGRGKSYFLGKLLKRVIFPESELVGTDPRVEHRLRMLTWGAYTATLGVVLLVVMLWGISFYTNKQALADVEKQVENYRNANLVPTDLRSSFLALLPKLNALSDAREIFDQAGWRAGFGLYQGDKIDAGIQIAYERLLREQFQDLLVQRLKTRMQEEGNNLDILYQLLRVYLMFGEPARMDGNVVMPWIKLDWERWFATDPETQAQLQHHLENLLSLSLEPVTLDENFVQAARNKLTQIPLVNQVYGRFKSEALFTHEHDLSVASQMAPNGGRVFTLANGKELDDLIIPGLFTQHGYTEIFLKKGMMYVKDAAEQNWVLDEKSSSGLVEIDRLYDDFKRLYLADYQKAWDGLINGVKFRPQTSNTQLIDTLDLLSRPDSPLKLLLELIEKNTTLSKLSAQVADGLAKSVGGAIAAPEAATQQLLNMAKQTNTGIDPIKALEAYFEPYNAQARGFADRPAPIIATLNSIKNLHDYLMQIGASPNSGGQALSTEAARFAGGGIDPIQSAKMEFDRLPGPIATSLKALTNTGGQQIKTGAKNQLNDMLKTSVTLPCKAALTARYPFARNALQDVLLADFAKVFAVNGIVDQFFAAQLKPFVDTVATQWQEMNSDKALGLSPLTIRQFQLAAKIRDAFFPTGGNVPQVQFELKPLSLDERIGTFRLNIEGQELVYRHGPEQLTQFKWPGINNSAGVRVVFETLDGRQVSRYKEGAWALFRMFDDFNIQETNLPDRFNLTIQVEGFTARFELRAASVNNPFGISEYQSFRCPESL